MRRWLVLLLGLAAAVATALAAAIFLGLAEPSAVTIQNSGETPVDLVVVMTNPGQFEWRGTLSPGQTVRQTARFSDNSFDVVCRSADGASSRSRQGYVTNGLSFAVTITVRGCDDVRIDDRPLF